MTREERVKKLRNLITCMKCEVSGKVCDDNCPTQYNAGNMGEIIENLEEIANILEQKPCEDWYDVPSNEMTLEQARQAVKELRKKLVEQEPRWIPIVTRKPTEEEKKDYFEQNGEELCYMIDSPMPYNGQEVLVSGGGYVSEDVFDEDFWNFENWDIENVEAWMPLPKPYEPKERSDKE